jgi:hypothetical protein
MKMRHVEIILGREGGRIKENDGGNDSNYNILRKLLKMLQCTPNTTIVNK